MPYDKTKPYSCPCCGYYNGDMVHDYYKHNVPLIKDEKIRKTVRTWANVNGATELKYHVDENSLEDIFRNTISFNHVLDLQDDYIYNIAELCGGGGGMNQDTKQMEAMFRLMFGDHYVSIFHVIDDDMIRKPVFQSQKIKSYENGDSVFKVTINWRLLNKLRKELCGEEEE